jgi:Tol biopolymer transport system component
VRVYQAAWGILVAALAPACSPFSSESDLSASGGLVFVRIVDGSNEVMRVRLADGAEQAITATPDRQETWPYWSSAAGRLVFQISHAAAESDLVLWSPERGETPLVETAKREERWPAWAPGQAVLVYAFRGGRPAAGLVTTDVETGEQRLVARSGRRDFFFRPSFSPDGARIVAQRRGPTGAGSQLWVIEDEAAPRPLTRGDAWFDLKPSFTRDGARVVFSRRAASGGKRRIVSVSGKGGDLRTLASRADDHSAHPSPVRDEFVFVSDRDGHPQIFLADLDGSRVRQLIGDRRSAFAPRWSPDGEKLVVTMTQTGEEPRLANRASLSLTNIVVLNRAGDALLDVPGFMPDWMPAWR